MWLEATFYYSHLFIFCRPHCEWYFGCSCLVSFAKFYSLRSLLSGLAGCFDCYISIAQFLSVCSLEGRKDNLCAMQLLSCHSVSRHQRTLRVQYYSTLLWFACFDWSFLFVVRLTIASHNSMYRAFYFLNM